MRSSKSRSRSKTNRPRTLGNIINRVFDSSGPEGKVRGTPQQIIEKYQMLARDAQLSNDRVAAENFLQHAEHYTRLLAEAMREMAAEQDSRNAYQQNGQNGQNGPSPRYDNRPDHMGRAPQFGDGDQPDISGVDVVYAETGPMDMPDADRQPRGYAPRPQRAFDVRQNDGRQNDGRQNEARPNDARQNEPRQNNRPRDDRPRDDRPRDDRRNDRPRNAPRLDAGERAGGDQTDLNQTGPIHTVPNHAAPAENTPITALPSADQPRDVMATPSIVVDSVANPVAPSAVTPFVSPADLVAQLAELSPAPKPRAPRVRRPSAPLGDSDAAAHPSKDRPMGSAESA